MPEHFGGNVEHWEDWSWNFKNYVSVHSLDAAQTLTKVESIDVEITDALLQDPDPDVTAQRINFSRKLHYLLALITKGSARLVVRQLSTSNGYETWRNLFKNFALPGATRHVGLLTRILKPVFRSECFEQDFHQWESLKSTFETQTGNALPDSVLVALLLNETSGLLQQHLRLNSGTLKTYADVRSTIMQYHQSAHVLKQSTLPHSGPMPMDIGYFGKSGGKGKGKTFGSKGKGKGKSYFPFGGKNKGKGKGKGLGTFKGKNSKSKGKGKTFGSKGKGKGLCHICKKPGHFARDCPDFASVGLLDDGNFEEWQEEEWQEEEWDFESSWNEWDFDASDDPRVAWFDFEWNVNEEWSDYSWSESPWPAVATTATLAGNGASSSSGTLPAGQAREGSVGAVTLSQDTSTPTTLTPPPPPGLTPTLKPTAQLSKSTSFGVSPGAFVGTLLAATFALGESCFANLCAVNTLSCANTPVPDYTLRHAVSLPENVHHYCDTFMSEHLIAPLVSNDDFILFDSGAAANVCPPSFGSDWPLLPLTESSPPLRAISGELLKIIGRRLVGLNFDGVHLFMHFYVCENIPYAIVSVARLLKQGFSVVLGHVKKTLKTPDNHEIPVKQHGSLLYLNSASINFDERKHTQVLEAFHEYFDCRTLNVRTLAPVTAGNKSTIYYHADRWDYDPDTGTLTRLHVRPRKTLFTPDKIKEMPFTADELSATRLTYVTFQGAEPKVYRDNWRDSHEPNKDFGESWTGKTVFKLLSKVTGKRITGKTNTNLTDATLRNPVEVTAEMTLSEPSEPATRSTSSSSRTLVPKNDLSQDLQRLSSLQSMRSELFRQFVLAQFKQVDPATGEPYNHDFWLQTPLSWIRFHHVPRDTFYVPDLTDEMGPREGELGEERVTLLMNDGRDNWITDTFKLGESPSPASSTFVGATCFSLCPVQHFPLAETSGSDHVAQAPRQLSVPAEPTDQERKIHELTHLPFRSWCQLCVQGKARESHSKTLRDRQPVIQCDFSFLTSESSPDKQVTVLNAVDVLTGMGLSVVVPHKGKSLYGKAELKKFIYECGRTFGIVQYDPEASLKALVQYTLSELGGMSCRATPVGWKQAHGAVGAQQATFAAQVRTLTMQVSKDYNFEVNTESTLFPWIVRHSQWTLNRYLEHSDGRTSYERRWGRRYNAGICNFAETVLFKLVNKNFKASPTWQKGIWLGKDTESDEHFVATSEGVKKARSVRRLSTSEQRDVELLKTIKATPWDPRGTKGRETDVFVLSRVPGAPGETLKQEEDAKVKAELSEPEPKVDDAPEAETFEDQPYQGTETSEADDFSAEQPSTPREKKRVTFDLDHVETSPMTRRRLSRENAGAKVNPGTFTEVEESQTKLQRVACFVHDHDFASDNFSVSLICSVDIKQVSVKDFDIPVDVNIDVKEKQEELCASHPTLWYETEYPEHLVCEGMNQEMQSMKTFDVYEEIPETSLSVEQLSEVIDTKWVHRYKGQGVRSRLVVRGFMQNIEDADDTFASTPTLITLKILLLMSLAKDWSVRTADVSTAFLHATLTTDVYVKPPAEYYPAGGVLWKLRRALYGLKNSPRLWQDHFAQVMSDHNFARAKSDANLYVHGSGKLYVLCYVDDLLMVGNDELIVSTLQELQKDLLLRETGVLENKPVDFLGRIITKHHDEIQLSMNSDYIDVMLSELGLSKCKPAVTPGADTLKTNVENLEPLSREEHVLYRRIVGKLLWLTNVRNDIMFAVKELSRGLQSPTLSDQAKLKHLMRYLSGSKDIVETLRPKIKLSQSTKCIDIDTFVDSDWAGCVSTRKSTSGMSLFVLGVNVCGISRTQQTVALSSGEAELYAIGLGISESLFVRTLLMESKLCTKCNIILHTDSSAGKSMASRHGLSKKTKHIHLRFLFMQDLILSGLIKIKKVLGTLNPADVFTKYINKDTLHRHMPTLGYFRKTF